MENVESDTRGFSMCERGGSKIFTAVVRGASRLDAAPIIYCSSGNGKTAAKMRPSLN